mgnify:FL=1|jgi:hypothetical protein
MFDQFTLDIIDTFDGIQAFARREGHKDPKELGPLRKAIEVLRQTATDMEQRAIRATDAAAREQFRVLALGFAAGAEICDHIH